jgi:hypothetical protein
MILQARGVWYRVLSRKVPTAVALMRIILLIQPKSDCAMYMWSP